MLNTNYAMTEDQLRMLSNKKTSNVVKHIQGAEGAIYIKDLDLSKTIKTQDYH